MTSSIYKIETELENELGFKFLMLDEFIDFHAIANGFTQEGLKNNITSITLGNGREYQYARDYLRVAQKKLATGFKMGIILKDVEIVDHFEGPKYFEAKEGVYESLIIASKGYWSSCVNDIWLSGGSEKNLKI